MFKKRLKGLLAMVLAGSMALAALPLTASATFSTPITISGGDLDGSTISSSDIGSDSFNGGVLSENTEYLTENNLWAIYSPWSEGYLSGYIGVTVSGDELASTLYNYSTDTNKEYNNTQIRYTHDLAFTTKDISDSNETIENSDLTISKATSFPYDISSVINQTEGDPLKEITAWTAWYNRDSGNIYNSYNYANNCVQINDTPKSITEGISAEIAGAVYIANESYIAKDAINYGKTIIQLYSDYKTFELPVYDGWGKATTDVISVTESSTGDLIPKNSDEKLLGEYKLVYKKDANTVYTPNLYITSKDGLWSAIANVADTYNEFDESKAALVRYVVYGVNEAKSNGSGSIGLLYSYDLFNGENTATKQYFDSHSAANDNIWQVAVDDVLFTDDVNTAISEILNTSDTDYISITNMANIAVTSEKPTVDTIFPEEEMVGYLFDYSVNKYPVSTDDLYDFLTEKKKSNAGYKYDAENWSLWGVTAASGALIKCSVPVSDKSKIGIDEYNNMSYKYADELLVYFPQVELTASVTVPEPKVGEAPAAKDDLTVNDDCVVTAVKWFDGNTELTDGDKFKAGKQYTIKATLKAIDGLQLIATTPTTIDIANSMLDPIRVTPEFNTADSTLTITHTFDALPLTAITAADIYVTAPVLGNTPDTAATLQDGINYTASAVAWSPDDAKFKADTAYTATVTLIPNSGYKFTASTAAKINGKNAQTTLNNDGTLTVSYTFAATQMNEITAADIYVTSPVLGNTPNTEATLQDGINYTASAVAWSPDDAKFKADTAYTATVTLTPNSGYKFTANTAAKINGKNAQTVLNSDGTLTVSYTFSKLSKGTPAPSHKPNKPVPEKIPAKTDKSVGWTNIINEINSADIGSTIKITLNDETTMPEDALNAAINRKVKLVMEVIIGRTWTIDGATAISGKNIDLSISGLNVGIPAEAYKDIPCTDSKQLKLYARELNFTAQITASIGESLAGQNAAIYLYNEEAGKLTFCSITAVGKDGNITFDVESGGKYFIALGSEVTAPDALCGDINGDGVVNALDASAILKNIANGTSTNKQSGDTNADGVVNALDAAMILKYVVGDIKTFPALA